jgi:hypothetical protein
MRFPTPRLCGSLARRWPRRELALALAKHGGGAQVGGHEFDKITEPTSGLSAPVQAFDAEKFSAVGNRAPMRALTAGYRRTINPDIFH